MSKSISILNETDIQGKNITAVNLAISLGLFEKKTLLIDSLNNLSDFRELLKLMPEERDIIPTRIRYLNFLNIPYDKPEDFNINFFEKIDETFEYIIINCPKFDNELFETVMTATDWIVIPFVFKEKNMEDLFNLVNNLKEQSSDMNFCFRIAGILLNKFNGKDSSKLNIFNNDSIFFNAKIPEFGNIDTDNFFSDIKSELSDSYFNFAIEVIEKISN